MKIILSIALFSCLSVSSLMASMAPEEYNALSPRSKADYHAQNFLAGSKFAIESPVQIESYIFVEDDKIPPAIIKEVAGSTFYNSLSEYGKADYHAEILLSDPANSYLLSAPVGLSKVIVVAEIQKNDSSISDKDAKIVTEDVHKELNQPDSK